MSQQTTINGDVTVCSASPMITRCWYALTRIYKMPMYKAVIVSLLSVLGLTACSSAPRQVQANVPLVEPLDKPLGEPLSAKMSAQLDQHKKNTLTSADYMIKLGPLYTSSLGKECRELTFVDERNEKTARIACTDPTSSSDQDRTWYLIPNIVDHATAIKL
ncbi:hypothetical protein [Salinivibrio kushneri]|uniref:hypothetical protein n=1 Tax=Salinivibrio kushneri TaxID=1908198 RepID=UPI0022B3B2F6|nr:hypothetical protein [Salinivibrio kushneri]WBA17140.1 hypothetical protein O4598_08270 [Salinivibrio kushneri]